MVPNGWLKFGTVTGVLFKFLGGKVCEFYTVSYGRQPKNTSFQRFWKK